MSRRVRAQSKGWVRPTRISPRFLFDPHGGRSDGRLKPRPSGPESAGSAGCPRGARVPKGGQLAVDDLLELGLRLRAVDENPVDKEAGSSRNSGLASILQVCFDLGLELPAGEA